MPYKIYHHSFLSLEMKISEQSVTLASFAPNLFLADLIWDCWGWVIISLMVGRGGQFYCFIFLSFICHVTQDFVRCLDCTIFFLVQGYFASGNFPTHHHLLNCLSVITKCSSPQGFPGCRENQFSDMSFWEAA